MGVINIVQESFISGLLNKKYRGNVADPIYQTGYEDGLNVLTNPQGQLVRRPGTTRIAGYPSPGTTSDVGVTSKQITFYSTGIFEYRLVFEPDELNIYDNTDALEQTLTSTGIDATAIEELAYDQGKDTMILCHSSFGFKVLVLDQDTGVFSLNALEIEDGPYETLNLDQEKKLHPGATTGATTLTAKNKAGTNITTFFTADDVGRLFRLRHSPATVTTWGVAEVTSLSGGPPSAIANVTIPTEYELGDTTGVKNWIAGAWYGTTYPTAIAFARDRLWAAMGERIFGSFANDFNRFSPTTENLFEAGSGDRSHIFNESCAIDSTIYNLKGEKIFWIHDDEVIHLGGENGHYTLRGDTLLGPITPSTATINQQSSMGCADIKPLSLGGLIYVHKSRKKLFVAERNFRTDRYDAVDLNLISDTVLEGRVYKILKLTYPWPMIWCILDDGDLACLTYIKEKEVVAWSKHRLASGQAIDGCVMKDLNGNERIYLTVQDEAKRFVEKMGVFVIDQPVLGTQPFRLLDGSLIDETFTGTDTISNLERFEGKTVYVIQDNMIVQSGVVSGNEFTLDINTGYFELGLAPDVNFTIFPLESAQKEQSSIGHFKQAVTLHLGLFRTGHLEVKQTGLDEWEEVPIRSITDLTANDKDLYTGATREFKVPQQKAIDLQFDFRQRLPSPLGISYIGAKLDISSM